MRLLLDTHAIIWVLEKNPLVPHQVKDLIFDPDTLLLTSVVSFWELSIKSSLKKIQLLQTSPEMLRLMPQYEVEVLGITQGYLETLETLPHHHKDPFDRLLIATALAENCAIVSSDKKIKDYTEIKVIW